MPGTPRLGTAQRLRTGIWNYLEARTLTFLAAAGAEWGPEVPAGAAKSGMSTWSPRVADTSSHHGGWVSRITVPKRERARYSHNTTYDLASELTQCPFHYILSVDPSKILLRLRGGEIDYTS